MPIDQLPGEIVVPSRDTEIDRWKRSHRLRVPEADTRPGTQPDVDARIAADALMPIYANAVVIGKNSVMEEARGKALDRWAEREGVEPRRGEVGGSGYVEAVTSSGGSTIRENDELIHDDSGMLFRVIKTERYFTGNAIPIVGKDGGTATNLSPGTPLKWTSPRPGSGSIVTVLEQADGSGLSGGRPAEDDREFFERIAEEKRTRAASGNDAEYQLVAQSTPAVAVQKAFTYPGIRGPGTTCLVFTLRPLRSGGSRVPNAVQIGLMEAHTAGKFPGDDGLFAGTLVEDDADVVYAVAWEESAVGWEDLVQWPPYYEPAPISGPGAVVVAEATSSTVFVLKTQNDVYTGATPPQAGQTIGFYDRADFTFRRKRIASVTGSGPWTIAVDVTLSVSDTGYVPVVGQRAIPWSDSLVTLLPGVHAYFDRLGPGEQVATFYDEGRRQRRSPRPPKHWPSALTTRDLITAASTVPNPDPTKPPLPNESVADVKVLEGDGLVPSTGEPGVLSSILSLRSLSVFPETP